MSNDFAENNGLALLREVENNLGQTAANYRKSGDSLHVYLDDQRFKISMAIQLLEKRKE
jgi:hypothetical protein